MVPQWKNMLLKKCPMYAFIFTGAIILIACDFMLFSFIYIDILISYVSTLLKYFYTHMSFDEYYRHIPPVNLYRDLFIVLGFFSEISHSNVFILKLSCLKKPSSGLLKSSKTIIISKKKYS